MSQDPLEEYAEKRHFEETPEPGPEVVQTGLERFVVQEHHASHLHWDFRLEMEGVLKSWAVPKGIPEEPGVRRLAIQVEDHPVSYINFEGRIAEGQYGAGEVQIWDRGTYQLLQNTPRKLEFILNGERLHGGYVLIQTQVDKSGKRQYLLQKMKTEKAGK